MSIQGWIAVASLIVGVLGIVIGGVLAFWFYRKGKNWHQITYQVVSDTPIVSVREQICYALFLIGSELFFHSLAWYNASDYIPLR